MHRLVRAAGTALLVAAPLLSVPRAMAGTADLPARYVHFGGPTAGFVVRVPQGWSYSLRGSAVAGSTLYLTGPNGSGLSAQVSRTPAPASRPLGSLLPAHVRVLRQMAARQWWGTGIGVAVLQDRGAVAAAVGGSGAGQQAAPSYQQHGVLRYRDYLYHLSVGSTRDGVQARAIAASIYTVMLASLTPAVYPVTATPQATVLRYWSAIGHHDVVAAYDLLSHNLRLQMATAGTDAIAFAHDAGQVRAMQVLAAVDITPRGARAGHREYQVTLRMQVRAPSAYHKGINVRFVTVKAAPATRFTILRIGRAPIPASGV